jgi:hypothetical protein
MARLALGVSLLGGRIERERMPMPFPDHFSDHADRYEVFRPTYQDALFAYLASLVPAHDLAWDCATGNGQAAEALIPHFDSVVATDATRSRSPRRTLIRRSPTSSPPPRGRRCVTPLSVS